MERLQHLDENGNAVMVDIHQKEDTCRVAKAEGTIRLNSEAFLAVENHSVKKGDVLSVARIAGIMAAKKNAQLIPLCHNIALSRCAVDFETDKKTCSIRAVCTVACIGKTGVEMEALTGASVALLTIYDMCKSIDRSMEITNIRLLEKDGGKSGRYLYEAD